MHLSVSLLGVADDERDDLYCERFDSDSLGGSSKRGLAQKKQGLFYYCLS
jgi:hypothetical protein